MNRKFLRRSPNEENELARKKKVNLKTLVTDVESGIPRSQIMRQFGFKSPGQVTRYYLDGLIDLGRAKPIVGRQLEAAGAVNVITVNKRGSLIIPKEMAEKHGYKTGDSFVVSKAPTNGINLKTQEK